MVVFIKLNWSQAGGLAAFKKRARDPERDRPSSFASEDINYQNMREEAEAAGIDLGESYLNCL